VLELKSNTKLVLLGKLRVRTKDEVVDGQTTRVTGYDIIVVGWPGTSRPNQAYNVTITGSGGIIGEVDDRPEITKWTTGIGIFFAPRAKNILIENISLSKCIGTCLSSSYHAENVTIRNVSFSDSLWYGISLTCSKKITVEHCTFDSFRNGGLDLEP